VDQRANDSPPQETTLDDEPLIRRLTTGTDTEDIAVYDVSDRQLYGCRNYRQLTGEFAQLAALAGCRPEVYQCVYWLTLAFFPIRPLGTFLVLPRQECDDSDGDAQQYRAVRMPMDWGQVSRHYLVAFTILLGVVGAVVAFSVLR
jgi:hypothetical protein